MCACRGGCRERRAATTCRRRHRACPRSGKETSGFSSASLCWRAFGVRVGVSSLHYASHYASVQLPCKMQVTSTRRDAMSNAVLSPIARPEPPLAPGASNLIAGALAAWFALVVLLGAHGAFVRPPGTAPLPIFIGFAVPIAIFFGVYWFSRAFRAFVLGLDLRFATAIQAWRFAGLGFIALSAYGALA